MNSENTTNNGPNYGRWLRIGVSLLSFGMIFPNAITEGMTYSAPVVLEDDEKKPK